MRWQQYIRIRTQQPTFLWRMVLGILAVGVIVGFAIPHVPTSSPLNISEELVLDISFGYTEDALVLFNELLANPDVPFETLLQTLPRFVSEIPAQPSNHTDHSRLFELSRTIDPQEVRRILNASRLASVQKVIALGLWQSLSDHQVSNELANQSQQTPPVRYANHAVGVYWETANAPHRAAEAYEREGRLPDASVARERAVEIYVRKNDAGALRRLASNPQYAKFISTIARIQIAANEREWGRVWWLIARHEWERFKVGPAVLSLFLGLCWFLFTVQAGQVDLPYGARFSLCGLAILLGILSIWPTDLLSIWQEVSLGLVHGVDPVDGIRYFVLGVGLREEFSKLLLLLPLVPLLVRRRNELEVLIVSACVGLGFAIFENANYFAASYGSSTVGRFLTANFFHMAATGLVGLAVVRAIWQPRARGPEALVVFGVVVFAHGLYDAAIAVPALAEFGIASSIIYILLAYQFFRELRAMRTERTESVSLTANFLCGVSLITAVTFISVSAQLGPSSAADILVPEVLSMALMTYMFLREMPNSLVTV